MAGETPATELAVNGGPKSVEAFEAKQRGWGLKVGVEEFVALADTWGYSEAAREKMREILEEEDLYVNPRFCLRLPSDITLLYISLPLATLRLRQPGSGLCPIFVSQYRTSPYSSRVKPGTQQDAGTDGVPPRHS